MEINYKKLPKDLLDIVIQRVSESKVYRGIIDVIQWQTTPEGYDFWKKANECETEEELTKYLRTKFPEPGSKE